MIKIYNNIIIMIKFLIIEKIFEKNLNCGLKNNGNIFNIDLF